MSSQRPAPEYEVVGPVGSPTGRPVGRVPSAGDVEWSQVPRPARPRRLAAGLAWLGILLVGLGHSALIWRGLGGLEGIQGEWPPLGADHGLHYHHGTLARTFLEETGTNSGYDPSFMSGHVSGVVSSPSSTLSDLVMAALPVRPALALKIYVLLAAALTPWLIAAAARVWRAGAGGMFLAVLAYVVYFWSDYPARYAQFGMIGYLLSVPAGLLAVAILAGYLRKGGFGRWLAAALACSIAFLIHATSAMLVGPAGLLAYAVAASRGGRGGGRFPISRHLGLLLMAPIILASNAFWWLPGWWLRGTIGGTDFAFVHPEGVWKRLAELAWWGVPTEPLLLGLALVGMAVAVRRDAVAGAALAGFLLSGFGWGYLAGFSRALDPLQPGRHTYACYAAACVATGIGLAEMMAVLRSGRAGRIDLWASAALLLAAVRMCGPQMVNEARAAAFGPEPFLSSRPDPRMLWLIEKVRQHVKPGERLLYEETGFAVGGLADPFRGKHYSPILPGTTGVEVIGGPYLHMTVTANFAQFGEGKLFGEKDWGRDHFVRHARLYRPAAIACWTPHSRAFCREHPDLIRVVEDDGTLLLGRVLGFEGATIRGSARVEAGPNRLVVLDAKADADGLVVLRYHSALGLVADPPTAIEEVRLEADPVPFIGLRPTAPGPITLRIRWPPKEAGSGP